MLRYSAVTTLFDGGDGCKVLRAAWLSGGRRRVRRLPPHEAFVVLHVDEDFDPIAARG